MSTGLLAAAGAIETALDGFDPRLLSGEDAARVTTVLARVEKRCAAARARAAARAAECGAHRDHGFVNPAEWVARLTGDTSSEARNDLETAVAWEDLSGETRADVAEGTLSLKEAHEIAHTEAVAPGCEAELRQVAREKGYRALVERARRKRQEAVDPEELERRRRHARSLRHWIDELGMVCVSARLTPEVGVPVLSRLEAETEREWRAGNRDSTPDQRAADAFVRLLEGKGKGSSTRRDLVCVWDLTTDTAHIPAVGPVSVTTAAEMAKDAFVTALTHDGVEVKTIARYGRYIPPELRLLVELGPPPGFDGAVCVDCGRRFRLQDDHVDPVANGGRTSHENLEPRCPPCHGAKTERDRKAGLLRGNREGRDPP